MSKKRVLLIIPCYNEQAAIAELLKEVAQYGDCYQAIVVDDGSHDATYKIASQFYHSVKLLRNLGIGGAVQAGIKYASENNFDFCVQIDGDGQHPPSEVSKLLQAYDEDPCSIIIGSRYLLHDTFRSTWARQFGTRIIAKALNILFPRCRVTDPTSGMRLLDSTAIQFFSQYYPHDFPEPISLAWAMKAGMTVGEVPVKMRQRLQGSTSIIGLKPIAYMLRVLGYIFLAKIYAPVSRS